MEKFTITNADNTRMNVDLIRYFKFKNDCYLIYTLNEIDEKGYLKLYLVKIMEELGFPVTHNIKDDKEWAGMQSIVKKVLKEIKSNKRKFLEDLNYDSIQGIKIVEPRFFKLDQKLAEVLSSNYNVDISDNINSTEEKFVESNNLDNNILPSEIINTSFENSEMTQQIQNIDNVAINLDQTSNNLESIEETLLKQGAFAPIQTENLDSLQQVISETTMTDTTNKNDVVQESQSNQANYQIQTEQVTAPINENVSIESISVNELNNSENIPIDTTKNEDKNSNNIDFVNYKELYLAEKEEKEAINNAMNNLVEQLIKYKEKYGELE